MSRRNGLATIEKDDKLICYTPKEVKEILNISQSQTYALFAKQIDPNFKSFRIGASYRIRKYDFEIWLDDLVKSNKVA
ncbi:MAG: helix-turn-helix domain-containing protein [Cellulosilyticum sp.]|nr:helix-turn-helix domain-containing protein [Cellulosilyticum sp.]